MMMPMYCLLDPAGDIRRGEDPGAAEQSYRGQAAAHEGGAHPAAGAHQPPAPGEVQGRCTEQVPFRTIFKDISSYYFAILLIL